MRAPPASLRCVFARLNHGQLRRQVECPGPSFSSSSPTSSSPSPSPSRSRTPLSGGISAWRVPVTRRSVKGLGSWCVPFSSPPSRLSSRRRPLCQTEIRAGLTTWVSTPSDPSASHEYLPALRTGCNGVHRAYTFTRPACMRVELKAIPCVLDFRERIYPHRLRRTLRVPDWRRLCH